MARKKPLLLEVESSTSPSQKDAVPIVPAMDARADGTCVVTRYEGVVLFSRSASGYADTYVETRMRNQEIALHPSAERFVVWTKTYAAILKKREVVVFTRVNERIERALVWESADVHGDKPIAAGFVGDRVVVAMQMRDYKTELHVYAPTAEGYERSETICVPSGVLARSDAQWAMLHRSASGWRGSFVSFGDGGAQLGESPLPELPSGVDVGAAAMNDAMLVVGMPSTSTTGKTNEGAAVLYRRSGGNIELVAKLGPTKSRKYLGFGAIPSMCGEHVALASLGWERVPKSHNEFVPRESVTSLYDSSGGLVAEGAPRRVQVEGVQRLYTHMRLTREHVLEFHADQDALAASRIPAGTKSD